VSAWATGPVWVPQRTLLDWHWPVCKPMVHPALTLSVPWTTASTGQRLVLQPDKLLPLQLQLLSMYSVSWLPLLCMVCFRCVSGCTCGESLINGHTTARSSLLNLHGVYVTQSPECVMSVEVRDT
jgi:hypothetical protein